MHITRLKIENFKCIAGEFDLELNSGLNILVGDNEAGKSTILEAIHLALSGWINGKYLGTQLNQSFFNTQVVLKYLSSFETDHPEPLPYIRIELYFEIEDDSLKALFEGNANSTKKKQCGIEFKISFNEKYQTEYELLLKSGEKLSSLPIEFYDYKWSSFARDDRLTPKIIPIKSSLIDSSDNRFNNGSDVYISRIIRDTISEEQKVKVSQAHRKLKEVFSEDESIKEINQLLVQKDISDKKVELSVDLSTKTAWETSLTTFIDDIPFNNIGRGEQCLIKTKLALGQKKVKEANIILLEEPENHLSHSKLNKLVNHIKKDTEKQILVSTHSSFVANQLGLGCLVVLNSDNTTKIRETIRITDLDEGTKGYFQKLPGYDTLRMILCRKAILVEGPSDELIVQRAYFDAKGVLPIEDEVDVISVGLSAPRFLQVAEKLKQPIAVVTDNDKDYAKNIEKRYQPFDDCPTIKICADNRDELNTLEPQITDANKENLANLRAALNLNEEDYPNTDTIRDYMISHKTDSALKIFDSESNIEYPQYILDAINWEYEGE